MMIIGIPECPNCKELKENYPHMPYIELPRVSNKPQYLKIKVRLGHLNVKEFPVIVNDGITRVLPEDCLTND